MLSGGAARIRRRLHLDADAGKLRAQLYSRDVVVAEQFTESGGWVLEVDLWADEWQELIPSDGGDYESILPQAVVNNA